MGFFGKLISTPIRIINAPLVAADRLIDKAGDFPEQRTRDGFLGGPLEMLAETGEEIADDVADSVKGERRR